MNKYSTWQEYAPNRFRRWDVRSNCWVIMEIHRCCIHGDKSRIVVEGKNFKEAKLALVSIKKQPNNA